MSDKILISACLLGEKVRYDGQTKPILEHSLIKQLQQQNRLVMICPEVSGGLPVPRPPAEQQGEQVITIDNVDVTAQFRKGAESALQLCKTHHIKFALLKAKSPSCGNREVYDGSFSSHLIKGMGMTAKLLTENGIRVFSELELDDLQESLNS